MNYAADIIIPVFNERENLPELLQRLRALPLAETYHLICVDNGSTDGSVAYLQQQADVTLLQHRSNRGYGASLRSGMQVARTDRWIIIDADTEYPPECIPVLCEKLQQVPVVYASRLLGKNLPQQVGMPWLQWWGNRLISGLYSKLFGIPVTDLYTGCKALRRECLQGVMLQRDGFEQVLELAVQLAARGFSIVEVPVTFSPRRHGVSKMRHISETVKYFFWLLYYRIYVRACSAQQGNA